MNLKESRMLFTQLITKLIARMIEAGFKPCIGKDGLKHMTGSLHYEGLAMDIDLFDGDGVYLTSTEAHRDFGMYWKGLHPLCRWGGDFKTPDGNHYSITFGGKA